ncbi:salicylate hydroxylase [Talaromyces pinophilus]|uniref:Salicylate hydroxylase n=1 Tax=Talaromyces pinophilus TaxID=128442 RepID=A0A6V8HK30_TALPI|nr:salicylate hydroxylase [Talaromyces pinophilus]
MSLEVIIVGAGIAGLCTAIALREAGHSVFEKSQFLGEAGAALLLSPNGARVLSHLNFSFTNAQANEMTCWEVLNGMTFEVIEQSHLHNAEEVYGAKIFTVHRSDLHNEFIRLALQKVDGEKDIELFLGSGVKSADTEKGVVELQNGDRHKADLIIGADGIHSVVKGAVVGQAVEPRFSGVNAFRFLIPTSMLEEDEKYMEMLKVKGKGSSIFVDVSETEVGRHLVWYDCHSGAVQNFVGIHKGSTESPAETEISGLKARMMVEFEHFHPNIAHIISVAPEVTDWPLYIHEPLPTWNRGKVLLIGDAAHPMLPFGGQGANQAIEDAGALGALLSHMSSVEDLPKRLALFDKVRRLRASRVQILSTVRLGREKDVEDEVRKYTDYPGQSVPTTFHERNVHDLGFDVYEQCRMLCRNETEM